MAITLETEPGNKPGTNKLESRLGTGARPQGTATCRPHASISKLAHLGGAGGAGGWGARGLDGPPLGDRAQKPAQPSKEACGEAAPKKPLRHASNNRDQIFVVEAGRSYPEQNPRSGLSCVNDGAA